MWGGIGRRRKEWEGVEVGGGRKEACLIRILPREVWNLKQVWPATLTDAGRGGRVRTFERETWNPEIAREVKLGQR